MIYDELINLESDLFMSILRVSKGIVELLILGKLAENSIFKNLCPEGILINNRFAGMYR